MESLEAKKATFVAMCSRMSCKLIGLHLFCFCFADNNELLFGTSVSAEVHPPLAYFSKYVQLEACWNLSIQYEFFAFLLKKCFIMLMISSQLYTWNFHVVV